MLCADRLTVKRGERGVVNNLSFQLKPGEVMCVTGANGSGKSTLIKAIAGIIPISGIITYNECDIKLYLEEYLSIICYQPDMPVVDKELTLYQNLELWASFYGREMTVPAVLHSMQLLSYAYDKVDILSRGQMQRLHLARLLVTEANIWLLDEPDAHLDDNWINYLQQMIDLKTSQGGIVVYASHHRINPQRQFIMQLGDK